jgi:hypothetical protein
LLGVIAVESGFRIEPAVDVALVGRQRDAFDAAVENRAAEAERRTGLVDNYGVQLPPAGEELDGSRHTRAVSAAAAHRYFVDAAHGGRSRPEIDSYGRGSTVLRKLMASIAFDQV